VFVSGPGGEATGEFQLPLNEDQLENLVLKLTRPRATVRRIGSSDLDVIRTFGGSLFNALFNGPVRDVYRSSLSAAKSEGCGMRVSLAMTGTPELMHVPWEFLYDDPAFLSISTWTPVVRYLDLASTRRPLMVEPPLRILAMVSNPSDVAKLDVAQERAKLEQSLAALTEGGRLKIRWLEEATLQALQRELRRADYHIFHYIGHGGYDPNGNDGVLALEDAAGRSRLVTGSELGTILADETTLRLAVLNACEGARNSISDPFSGIASGLVRREIPAVVAMQLEITDRAAITFASEFYAAVADGYAVDGALAEARKAIFADENEVEWATPVLFMRVADGRIFDVPRPTDGPEGEETEPDESGGDRYGERVDQKRAPVTGQDIRPEADEEYAPHDADESITVPTRDDRPTSPNGQETTPVLEPVPRRVLATLGVCTLILAVGVVYPWDHYYRGPHSWLRPFFGQLPNSQGGAVTVLSPIVVAIIAATATLLIATGRRLQLAAGLLIACGLAASAKYFGLLARVIGTKPTRIDSAIVFSFVLAAAFTMIVFGTHFAQLAGVRLGREDGKWPVITAALGSSSFLILAGCLVPFNGGGSSQPSRSVVPQEGSQLLDALVVGLALLAIAICLRFLPRMLTAGIVLALGLESIALWVRYLSIPLMESSRVASVGVGGFLGIAGAAVAVAVGIWLLRTPQNRVREAPVLAT
jgi:hypothetical protein